MAPRAEKRQTRTPRERLAGGGVFFPNEVVRILGLERVDYRQLRRLFRLVKAGSDAGEARGWTRLSFTELAALRVAIELAGGVEALKLGSRLRLKPIEDACRLLREHYGIAHPLLRARFRRRGDVITAAVDGVEFAPASGQVIFRELFEAATKHVGLADAGTVRKIVLDQLLEEQSAIGPRPAHLRSAGRSLVMEIALTESSSGIKSSIR